MGKPSNMVAMAEGVPGIPIRQAVMSPPHSPPTYTPVMAASPWRVEPKVNGSTRMMVMVMVTPGSAPPMTPARVPRERDEVLELGDVQEARPEQLEHP